ncbi:putative protein kinase C delta type [Nematocida displodere]|uniref:protein kinase C n=1 Tax=Nematocida displodere TaxID=1805483 RepID=A0A177EHZ1_9MICR|nr:putative protein kinase C delta type [Nematocida displodere]
MKKKKESSLKMIEKLKSLLPALSGEEAEAARFQIENLCAENPLLGHLDGRASPATILECWEQRDLSRMKVLQQKLAQEKNLLKGYKTIQTAEKGPELESCIEYVQRKVYFITCQVESIKEYVEDASGDTGTVHQESAQKDDQLSEKNDKRTGTMQMTIIELNTKNPLHHNSQIIVYLKNAPVATIAESEIGEGRAVSFSFEEVCHVEIEIRSEKDVMVGWIFFPVEDLVDAEDKGKKTFFFTMTDHSNLAISFGKCILQKKGLQRAEVAIFTKRVAGHNMRKLENMNSYYCEICSNGKEETLYFRCDWCKYTCHMKCLSKIFFVCVEYAKKQQKEEAIQRLEREREKIRKERLGIILAAVEIREKPEDDAEIADRTTKVTKEPEAAPEDRSKPTKRYAVAHDLKETKTHSLIWCSHCGEKISLFSEALECTICHLTYHTDCKAMVFKSCGISEELRTSLITYTPAPRRLEPIEDQITLNEFEFQAQIGGTAYGKIYLCNWRNQKVALKAIKKEAAIVNDITEYLEIERKCLDMTKGSKNPFLAQLQGYFQTDTHVFFIIEFVAGGDLYYHIQRTVFTENTVRQILAEIILGVEFLHKNNVIYRNLKLANVLVDEDGHVKITDFSLCSIGAKNGIAHTFCGTIDTVAPEMIAGVYTKSVDWWSLGVVAYQLVMKKSPFTGETVQKIRHAIEQDDPEEIESVPEPIKNLILSLLEKNPENRLGNRSITQIKKHPYFEGVEWSKLKNKEEKLEWAPEIAETLNFDPEFTSEDPTLSPGEPIADETQKLYFQNF